MTPEIEEGPRAIPPVGAALPPRPREPVTGEEPKGQDGRDPGAAYAAAARLLSLLPPIASGEAAPEPLGPPGLPLAALRQAGLVPLLPGGAAGIALPLGLALLRPDVRRWLGADGLARLAAALARTERETVALLDALPLPPAPLGEAARWAGRQVPLLRPDGGLSWLELFWRPDRPARGQPARRDRCVLAARLVLPGTGRIALRARLEDDRLDAVVETARALPRGLEADLEDSFAAVLARLRLQGSLTLRHSAQDRDT